MHWWGGFGGFMLVKNPRIENNPAVSCFGITHLYLHIFTCVKNAFLQTDKE